MVFPSNTLPPRRNPMHHANSLDFSKSSETVYKSGLLLTQETLKSLQDEEAKKPSKPLRGLFKKDHKSRKKHLIGEESRLLARPQMTNSPAFGRRNSSTVLGENKEPLIPVRRKSSALGTSRFFSASSDKSTTFSSVMATNYSTLRQSFCNVLLNPPFFTVFTLIKLCKPEEIEQILSGIVDIAIEQCRADDLIAAIVTKEYKDKGEFTFFEPNIVLSANTFSDGTRVFQSERNYENFQLVMIIELYFKHCISVPRKLQQSLRGVIQDFKDWETIELETTTTQLKPDTLLSTMISHQFSTVKPSVIMRVLLQKLLEILHLLFEYMQRFPVELEEVLEIFNSATLKFKGTKLSQAQTERFVLNYFLFTLLYRPLSKREPEQRINNVFLMIYVLLKMISCDEYRSDLEKIADTDLNTILEIKQQFSEFVVAISHLEQSFEDKIASFSTASDSELGFSLVHSAVLDHAETIWNVLVENQQINTMKQFLPFLAFGLKNENDIRLL